MNSGRNWMVVVVAAVAVWAFSTRLDHAQSTAPAGGTKVGVVDLVYIFNTFEQTKVLNMEMQEETVRVQQEADRKLQVIKDEEAALEAFTPDSADYYTRRQKIRKMKMDHRVWASLEKERVGEDYVRWVKKTYEMVTDEIAAVARERGFQLVMTREEVDTSVEDPKLLQQLILNRKVVYSDDSVDLTQEVLANLNAAFAAAGGSVRFSR